jgi:hypothetical protein
MELMAEQSPMSFANTFLRICGGDLTESTTADGSPLGLSVTVLDDGAVFVELMTGKCPMGFATTIIGNFDGVLTESTMADGSALGFSATVLDVGAVFMELVAGKSPMGFATTIKGNFGGVLNGATATESSALSCCAVFMEFMVEKSPMSSAITFKGTFCGFLSGTTTAEDSALGCSATFLGIGAVFMEELMATFLGNFGGVLFDATPTGDLVAAFFGDCFRGILRKTSAAGFAPEISLFCDVLIKETAEVPIDSCFLHDFLCWHPQSLIPVDGFGRIFLTN